MKTKQITVILFLTISFFLLGFMAHKFGFSLQISNEKQKNVPTADTSQYLENRDLSKELKGKYMLEGAEYAGFEFINAKTISWTNEMFPFDPDTMRIKWIDNNTFFTTNTRNIGAGCAPTNSFYKVTYYDGSMLRIMEYWSGWGELEDEVKSYSKQ